MKAMKKGMAMGGMTKAAKAPVKMMAKGGAVKKGMAAGGMAKKGKC